MDSKRRRKIKYAAQCLVFLLIIASLLKIYYRVITPKFFTEQIYSTTTTYQGFYDMDRDTVDVLFFGASYGSCAFLPQELYNACGIRSYNLSCEAQSMLTSYYWLKEALRTQKPKAVVIEASRLFADFSEGPLVAGSDLTRKAFDYMKWSPVKAKAVKDICRLDDSQTELSYIFPNIRYHDRTDIGRKDFRYRELSSYSELKGYTFIQQKYGGGYSGYDTKKAGGEGAELNPLMAEYFEKLKELCQSSGIELLSVLVPSRFYGPNESAAVENYTAANGLRLINFNDSSVLSAAGYDFANMNSDKGHANIWGAACITDYIGKVLSEEYGMTGTVDRQWESTREYYDFMLTQAQLWYMTDIDEYRDAVSDIRYHIAESSVEEGTQYDIYEERTGRLVDTAVVLKADDGKPVLSHKEVDIN